MKKAIIYLSLIIAIITISCNKSDERTNLINDNYEHFLITNYEITIDKDSGLMMVDIDNNKKYKGEYKLFNIKVDENGKLTCPKDMSFYFIPFDDNTIAIRLMDPVYKCDCIDSPDPLNNCDYFVDGNKLRCGGSDCCEGYIEDDDIKKGFNNKYTDGILLACKTLILNGKKID